MNTDNEIISFTNYFYKSLKGHSLKSPVYKRVTRIFGGLNKRKIKETIRNGRSSSFELIKRANEC